MWCVCVCVLDSFWAFIGMLMQKAISRYCVMKFQIYLKDIAFCLKCRVSHKCTLCCQVRMEYKEVKTSFYPIINSQHRVSNIYIEMIPDLLAAMG